MDKATPKPSDRVIPYYIVVFFLVLIFLLIWFILISVRNYPGEITKDAYKKGLMYNQAIEISEAQDRLGWESEINFLFSGLEVNTTFTLADKNGKPITGAVTNAWFIRPTHAGSDKEKIPLTPDGKGNYKAKTTLAWHGEWEVHISATYGGQNYQKVKTLNLQ